MPIDLNASMAAFSRGLEEIPRVIIAPLLLAGPTLLWLLYRYLVRPGTFSQSHEAAELTAWVCDSCASLTPIDQPACYRCHAPRPELAIEPELESEPEFEPDDDGVGVAVGPGLPIPASPTPVPLVRAAPPESRDGPVISPPTRIRVSGGKAAPATSRPAATAARRRSKRA